MLIVRPQHPNTAYSGLVPERTTRSVTLRNSGGSQFLGLSVWSVGQEQEGFSEFSEANKDFVIKGLHSSMLFRRLLLIGVMRKSVPQADLYRSTTVVIYEPERREKNTCFSVLCLPMQ